jgi:hypothetical protein
MVAAIVNSNASLETNMVQRVRDAEAVMQQHAQTVSTPAAVLSAQNWTSLPLHSAALHHTLTRAHTHTKVAP